MEKNTAFSTEDKSCAALSANENLPVRPCRLREITSAPGIATAGIGAASCGIGRGAVNTLLDLTREESRRNTLPTGKSRFGRRA